jgi:hypothetical protein
MSFVQNTEYDTLYLEMKGDRMLPAADGINIINLPQGMQFKWLHKVGAIDGCNTCGSGMVKYTYYVRAIVGDCEDKLLAQILAIPQSFVIETRNRRVPSVCTMFDTDRRGTDVDTLVPPHLREGYKW